MLKLFKIDADKKTTGYILLSMTCVALLFSCNSGDQDRPSIDQLRMFSGQNDPTTKKNRTQPPAKDDRAEVTPRLGDPTQVLKGFKQNRNVENTNKDDTRATGETENGLPALRYRPAPEGAIGPPSNENLIY